VKVFDVDMSEAEAVEASAYRNFNAFFTRALKPGTRPIARGQSVVASPVDGSVSEVGKINTGELIQAKGQYYSVRELIGAELATLTTFQSGSFATLYLSPRDYHRIHMPCAATLRRMAYFPGKLFSVSPATVRTIPRLFAGNERVVCLFDSELGALVLALVGAVNVAAIETVWAGLVTPPRGGGPRCLEYPAAGESGAISFVRGAEMGRFNMGSTVVMLIARDDLHWRPELVHGASVRMGEALGKP
jgi:phosphatidylserine decarboxylase